MELTNKTVLVTGGASGLGAACVRLLTQAGANATIADMNSTTGTALAAELGTTTLFAQTNLADEASVKAALQATIENFGSLHIVINCAGIGVAERVLGKNGPSSLDAFSKVINVNLIGTFNIIRLAPAIMSEDHSDAEGERGVIINTASVAAFDGQI